jgi:hypothetical protein
VRAEATGQSFDALDCLVATLADDVGCPELLGERDPVGVTPVRPRGGALVLARLVIGAAFLNAVLYARRRRSSL